jgi:hypothetical protein
MRHIESCEGQQLAGRARFHGIVNKVLQDGGTSDWVSIYGDGVTGAISSGLDPLLDRCEQYSDRSQQYESNQTSHAVHESESEEVFTTLRR